MNNSRFSLSGRSVLSRPSRQNISTPFLLIFICLTGLYLFVVSVLEKIGLGEVGLFLLILTLPVTVFLTATMMGNVSGSLGHRDLSEFTYNDGRTSAGINAIAASAEWLSLVFIVGFLSALANTNHDALAMAAGVFCGLLFAAILVLPGLPKGRTITPGQICAQPFQGISYLPGLIKFIIAIIVIISVLSMLVHLADTAGDILRLYFAFSKQWAAFLLLTPVVIILLSGGMKSITFANLMLFWIVSAALFLPVIWLSLDITSNPIPQLSFGSGALQPILQVEQQLVEVNSDALGENNSVGNFEQLSGFFSFIATFILIVGSTMAMPQFYSRISCVTGDGNRVRSVGWMLLLVAIVVSVLPAVHLFAKFEIYRDLLGLQLDRMGSEISWLIRWARIGDGQFALICGKPAISLEQMIAACGNGPDYLLNPSDINLDPLIFILGLGEIAEMPKIYSALMLTGLLSSALAAAAVLFMVVINTIDDFFFGFDTAKISRPVEINDISNTETDPDLPQAVISSTPVARHLFIARMLIIGLLLLVIWLLGFQFMTGINLTRIALIMLASAVFPLMILGLWWYRITGAGMLAGAVTGLAASLYLMITILSGANTSPGQAEPLMFNFPLFGFPLQAEGISLVIMAITLISSLVTSELERMIRSRVGSGQSHAS